MAASPQRETIMVSAMPTVTASSCSTSSGPTSLNRSRWLNSGARPPKHKALFCTIVCFILSLTSSHTFFALPGRRAFFSHRCIHHNTAASCCKESASAILYPRPGPCLFHHFAKHISPVFVRCDKITFFARTRELFSKKLLYFSVKSVILYPTGAPVGYKAKRRAFRHSCCSSFYYYAIFFIYLLIIYPVLKRATKKRFPTCTGERFLVVCRPP